MRRVLHILLLLIVTCSASACAGAKQQQEKPETYAEVVEQRFQSAEADFEDGRYLDAIRKFNTISNKFPYSRYAALAELRVADAHFEQEQYATAVEQYRNFIQLHPNHEKRTYAHFKVALAFYELMPDDWFFAPPAYERDLAKTKDAARELRFFVKNYPDSKYSERAEKLLAQARRRLADHEFYVAKFYMKRENYEASSMRLTYLLKNYSGLGLDAPALLLLAKAYLNLGDLDRATDALADLITVHPESEYAEQAREYVAEYDLDVAGE
ncbi:MAG: outer membrane protein assembly factor BamD [Myxococcota bacterium]